jgi:hypothetical protein
VAATNVQAAIAEVSGDVTALDTAKLDKTGGTISSNLTITGNLTVSGAAVATGGMPIITDATTTRTLALADNGSYIRCTSGSATTVTVPPNSSVAFPTGAEVTVMAAGAGTVTLAEGAGVTINSLDDLLDLSGRYAAAVLKKVGTNEWDLIGGLA